MFDKIGRYIRSALCPSCMEKLEKPKSPSRKAETRPTPRAPTPQRSSGRTVALGDLVTGKAVAPTDLKSGMLVLAKSRYGETDIVDQMQILGVSGADGNYGADGVRYGSVKEAMRAAGVRTLNGLADREGGEDVGTRGTGHHLWLRDLTTDETGPWYYVHKNRWVRGGGDPVSFRLLVERKVKTTYTRSSARSYNKQAPDTAPLDGVVLATPAPNVDYYFGDPEYTDVYALLALDEGKLEPSRRRPWVVAGIPGGDQRERFRDWVLAKVAGAELADSASAWGKKGR